jgi:integrase
MGRTIKVILYSRKGKGNKYPVKIRVLENRKSRFITLPFQVEPKYFLKSSRISTSHPNHEEYNLLIEKEIEKCKNEQKNEIKPEIKKINVFTDFEHKINFTLDDKYGNRKRHKTILIHLNNFWGNKNLNYGDIDKEFFEKFRKYLSRNIKPKNKIENIPSNNTINGYMKVLSSFLNEKKKEGKYIGDITELRSVIPKKTITSKIPLESEDIYKLENIPINYQQLRKVVFNSVNTFMFNFWSHGLRIGDCLSLKWGKIINNNIVLTIGKTNRKLYIPLNNQNCFRLLWNIEGYSELYDWKKKEFVFKLDTDNVSSKEFNNNYSSFLKSKYPYFDELLFRKIISYYQSIELWKKNSEDYHLGYFLKDPNFIFRDTILSKSFYDYVKNIDDNMNVLTNKLKDNRDLLLEHTHEYIKYYSSKEDKKNIFIFPFLRGLENETDIDIIHKKISSSTTLINKYLREIGSKLNIDSKITNHISRHSITSMSKKLGVDIYDLKNWLGHSSVKQTELYINSISSSENSLKNTKKINDLLG